MYFIEKYLYFQPKQENKVPWPSWLRRGANNAKISGSIPLGTIYFWKFHTGHVIK